MKLFDSVFLFKRINSFFKTKKSTKTYLIFRRNLVLNGKMKWEVYVNIDNQIQVKASGDFLLCISFFMGGGFLSNKGKDPRLKRFVANCFSIFD